MLDIDTKRRIDTARDILVGKVPDPKSQVEQITIALIYKFMDDMDLDSEELGGERKFFMGDFARFGWAKLMHSGLGGHETLNLYAEAITTMPQNPGIPPLFRDIFKNAYLPYRDPETLRAFLKVIDEFVYDHSERLGDAFEYLLSVLGSQGDAGQFRTPRHIIDFMVSIVDPRKDETVLDPACGTAGFLISSYKHILKANTGADGQCALTPDERVRLAGNFRGYDISPDMVRLSLVNLYLHDFKEPHIYEYDTLTSLERWGEHADVILANPPFMSPKGGIIPHNRFGVQSKRSEVLFVDYMAEHLTPDGRAGIIVPEGIIFHSAGAYTQLRRMLVEDYLAAVISLPAGVFNPYSGVKTSILILDKALAKKAEGIAFFKVENDGYGLGAQRRPVEGGQLEAVAAEAAEYLRRLRAGDGLEGFAPLHGLVVGKAKIAAGGEYNLSVERYKEVHTAKSSYPRVALGDCFLKIGNGVNVTQHDFSGKYRVSRIQTISDGEVNLEKTKYTDDEVGIDSFLCYGDILFSHINSIDHLGKTAIFLGPNGTVIHGINLLRLIPDRTRIDPFFAIYLFKTNQFISRIRLFAQKAVNQASIKTSDIRRFEIPLPPLEVQREIVAEIEGYQKVIDGARAVLEGYRPHIPVDPAWPMVALGEVCELVRGVVYSKDEEVTDGGVQILRANNIDVDRYDLDLVDIKRVQPKIDFSEQKILKKGDIFICLASGSKSHIGKAALIKEDTEFYFGGFMGAIRVQTGRLNSSYLFLMLTSGDFNRYLEKQISGVNINNLSSSILNSFEIPLPSLESQCEIVAEIEAEQALVGANRELIERMERKIQVAISRVWGEGVSKLLCTKSTPKSY